VWRRVDDVLRFAYVLIAPAVMVALAKLVPITGIVISTGIATIIALTGSSQWIRTVATIKIVGKPLAKFARLGEYYRTHPPKPLLYYVAYPLLFPYWLFNKAARTEFLVYKRIGVVALLVTIGTSTYDYFHNWVPLPGKYFANTMFATAVMQLLITFMFVMPIVTTLVTYQRQGHKKTAWILTACALILGAVMWVGMSKVPSVTFATQARLRARIKYEPEVARAAMHAALDAGNIDGAHAALEAAFRRDEVRAFHIQPWKDGVLLWAKTKSHEVAWTAKLRTGFATSAAELPAPAREALDLEPTAAPWP
jgi:hypothetical protein